MDCYAPSADGTVDQAKSSAALHEMTTTTTTTTGSIQHGQTLVVHESERTTTTNEPDDSALLESSNDDGGAALLLTKQHAVSDEAVAASLAIAWNDDDQAKLRAAAAARGPDQAAATQPGAVSVETSAMAHGKNDNVLHSAGGLHGETDCRSGLVEMPPSGGLDGDPDLEYGEYGGQNDTNNLAVAVTVLDDSHDGYMPSAVEFDVDSKPAMGATSSLGKSANKCNWFVLYPCWMLTLAVLGMLVGVVVVRSAGVQSSSAAPAALSERETVGIRESIRHFLGPPVAHLLDDPSHAYRQALDWIQNDDPLALTPASPNFIQRYLLAYLYYSTSTHGSWNTGCDPESVLPSNANSSSSSSSDVHDDDCIHLYTDVVLPDIVFRVSAKRWLSGHDECQWGGIACDGAGQVVELMFSTFWITCAVVLKATRISSP
jgi:hypothetical protein